MRRIVCNALLATLAALVLLPHPVSAQDETLPIAISAPSQGEALRGVVNVTGTSQVDNFRSAEVAFAYGGDTTGTWFLIQSSDQPVEAGLLATWDTTTMTDGVYLLRLRVYLQDGQWIETTVTGLRVRNYTPAETPTPTATFADQPTPVPATATRTPFPTPTLLPPNPAAVAPRDVYASMGRGALLALVLLAGFGLLIRLRRE
jgi:hypothetical protein